MAGTHRPSQVTPRTAVVGWDSASRKEETAGWGWARLPEPLRLFTGSIHLVPTQGGGWEATPSVALGRLGEAPAAALPG